MTYDDTNRADDYATGDSAGPSRDEILERVLEFDDANNGLGAYVQFYRNGDFEIWVTGERSEDMRHFETLWEFEDWWREWDARAEIQVAAA